ncbi:MAG: hypothetical protein JXJ22_01180 [Bacteroidales bacterium]|nr:hypothetical protein [Bacteroidales bacterium]
MKTKVKIIVSALLIGTGVMITGCKSTSTKENTKLEQQVEKTLYTCPMHAEVIQDEPGNCPKCGMVLIEKSTEMKDTLDTHEHMNMN